MKRKSYNSNLLTFRVPLELKQDFERIAQAKGQPARTLAKEVIEKFVQQQQSKSA